jgi:hypothetical protein
MFQKNNQLVASATQSARGIISCNKNTTDKWHNHVNK